MTSIEHRAVVVQSMIAQDGRTAVLEDAVGALLDALGPTWRIELWAPATTQADRFVAGFGDDRLVLHGLPGWWARMPSSFHIPMSARRVNARGAGADLLVDCNNTRLRDGFATAELHYVHHPAEAHQRDPNLPWFSRLAWLLGTRALPSGVVSNHAVMLANSTFTAERVAQLWRVATEEIAVLPPPFHAIPNGRGSTERAATVVSLGAFLPAKRQDEQLLIAAQMPDVQFVLAGRSTRRPYMTQLRRRATRLTNVVLRVDPSDGERDELLRGAAVFLHTRRGEHYGIAIAEAISAGCVPVVHDSGGARDLVASHAGLCLFGDMDEAVTRLRAVLTMTDDERAVVCRDLQAGLEVASAAAFREAFAHATHRAMAAGGLK